MIGIYKITNTLNGKCYIGQSIDIQRRWEEHLYRSSNCIFLKYALYKYGASNFTFEVIEECEPEMLNEREMYWIKYYNSFGDDGYNLTAGGSGTLKYNLEVVYEDYLVTQSIEKTAKNIGCHKNTVRRILREYGINLHEQSDAKPIEQIDTQTLKVIKQYTSIQEAADEMGVEHAAIRMALIGKHKTSAGYYWRFAGEDKQFEVATVKQWKTRVQQLDYNEDIVLNEFESAADAAEYLGKERKNGGSQITAVCNGRKKSAYGFRWRKM